jgi:hypothetical protein
MNSTTSAIGYFPVISTVFDSEGDQAHGLFDNGAIRTAILRLLPSDFLFQDGADTAFLEEFQGMLPVFIWKERGIDPCNLSLFLLTRHRHNAVASSGTSIKHFFIFCHRFQDA